MDDDNSTSARIAPDVFSDGDRLPGGSTALVTAAEELALIKSILSALGVPPAEAAIQAELLLEADLRGHPSHGLQRLPVIVERIRSGVAVPGAAIAARWPTAAFVSIDGARGLGPVVAFRAIELICERAKETGVAIAAISNNNHLGMLAPYVERIADRGQIGLAMTTSEALVHPFGGRRAMIGTNPIAVALPATPEPFVFDMATGEVSMGRILAHLNRGESIPLGWALDEDGHPTSDPAAASRGSISPFGGAKGSGLGLAIELLVAVLTQSATGRHVLGTLDTTEPCTKGDLLVCLDPATLGIGDVAQRVTPYLREIREQSARPGEIVTTPGDRSHASRTRRLEHGIPVATSVWTVVQMLRQEVAARW
jgi:LDH2 family malate/lactate/ureidoglycolate dehydrogenase